MHASVRSSATSEKFRRAYGWRYRKRDAQRPDRRTRTPLLRLALLMKIGKVVLEEHDSCSDQKKHFVSSVYVVGDASLFAPGCQGRNKRKSPRVVFDRASAPEGISITAKAPKATAIRHGRSAVLTLITRPVLATNATSIEKRINTVWIAEHGAMIIALPSGRKSRPSSPLLRAAESNAVSS
jgi:hypothetical protein